MQKVQVILNLCIGLFIVLLYQYLSDKEWGERIVNAAFDGLQVREAKQAAAAGDVKTPVFFIDITEKSYDAWGRPLITPRRELAKLIKYAQANKARVIVLDILLDKHDCCDPAGDQKLRYTLQRIIQSPNAPSVISTKK